MASHRRLPSAVAVALLVLMAAACSDGPTAPEPEPDAAQLGTIHVSAQTTGGDLDSDGYEVVIAPGVRRNLAMNSTAIVTDLTPGVHVLALEGVADNCEVTGPNPLSVTISAGATREVSFQVVCATTGFAITTSTTGPSGPSIYVVFVDGQLYGSIGANASLVVSRLTPGSHTVSLALADNCSVAGGFPFTAEVSNRTVTPVLMEITCVQAEPLDPLEEIAYVIGDSVKWIVVSKPDGSEPVTLAPGDSPDWSPDGMRLVFSNNLCSVWAYGCDGGLVVIDLEARNHDTLSAGAGGHMPAWSPTGDAIVFVRYNEPAPRFERLYVLKLDGSTAAEIATAVAYSVSDPAWSPDGQRIAFACAVSSGKFDICVINRDGTGFVRLTNDAQSNSNPAWSPDGATIAFTATRFQGGEYETTIALMAAEGGAITRVTSGFEPAWSRDGSKLVFVGEDGNGLFTVNIDGSNLTRLTTGRHHAPAWRPSVDPCNGCWDY